jgi:hypothetical protein
MSLAVSEKRNKWIPRLFILAIAPSVVMVMLLLFFPESQYSRCPLLVPIHEISPTFVNLSPGQPFFSINQAVFTINNTRVFPGPSVGSPGENLVMLGIVLDVRSASVFYGKGAGYHPLASGKDSTRALLISSLDEGDMVEDISDKPLGEMRDKLRQWLSFFLNKYKQIGVVVGRYWRPDGTPTPELEKYMELLESIADLPGEKDSPVMQPCLFDGNTVKCREPTLTPKIKRVRGESMCICADENRIFGLKTEDFVIIHFNNCTHDGTACTISSGELGDS